MMDEIHRFSVEITPAQLGELFLDREAFQTVNLGLSVDLDPITDKVDELLENQISPPEWDRELVELVHTALSGLSRRDAADMRVWHWLCTGLLSRLVWGRWNYGIIPDDPGDTELTKAQRGRFLGKRSLNGVSRNALARLWWCGHTLYSAGDGYSLSRQVLEKQDLFQAIYERKFGLYPPAAKACVRSLQDVREDQWRLVTRVLDHHFSTISVEAMDESGVTTLITSVLND